MNADALEKIVPEPGAYVPLPMPACSSFDLEGWLNYFERNRATQSAIRLPAQISLPVELKAPLLKSLQKFQIGETGDGRHLKRFAATLACPRYLRSIDLFVKEEQVHGQILAEIILSLDGCLLGWHWSDLAFIALRRLLGLKTEIFIILIAEIIGKCFYKTVAERLDNELLSNAFAIIVCDEIAHLRFHSEFIHGQLQDYPAFVKALVYAGWSFLFYAALSVFVMDHAQTLRALGSSGAEFLELARKEFNRSAACIFQA